MLKNILILIAGLFLCASLFAYEQRSVLLVNCSDYIFTQSLLKETTQLFRRYDPVVTEEKDSAVTIEAQYGRNKVIVKGFIDEQQRKTIVVEVPDALTDKVGRWLGNIEKGTRNYIKEATAGE
ncbi:MAG: hypothetical protein LBQ83_01480 [Candidatus Margulisbacteria bacterium]|jgi:hypothetical protein|nr:hypothetical protein [Candidatus Margulisiibacteriota bacterium]